MLELERTIAEVQELKNLADQAVADEEAKFAEDLRTARGNATEIQNNLF